MVSEDPVDLNLTMSPSSRKIPALLTKNSAQPRQIESCGEIMWIRVRPIDDDADDDYYYYYYYCHCYYYHMMIMTIMMIFIKQNPSFYWMERNVVFIQS